MVNHKEKNFAAFLLLAIFNFASLFADTFIWKTATPKDKNMDAAKIAAFNKTLLQTQVTSCLIVKDGVIVSEYYKAGYDERSVFEMHSVSKSITSALVGFAIRKGFFSLDDRIEKFFPELSKKEDARFRRITVRHLLTNTSGLTSTDSSLWGAWRMSDDWIDFLFSRPMQHEPGKIFEYSTGNTHLLSAIIQKTSGLTLDEFAKNNLFNVVGMQSAYFDADKKGIGDGGNGAHMTSRDMARFGLLYLQEGRWEDEDVISPIWIAESTKIQVPNQARYGYQWWVRWFGKSGERGYFAHGWGEQVICVIPSKNLIVTFTSRYADNRLNATYWKWIGDVVDAVE